MSQMYSHLLALVDAYAQHILRQPGKATLGAMAGSTSDLLHISESPEKAAAVAKSALELPFIALGPS